MTAILIITGVRDTLNVGIPMHGTGRVATGFPKILKIVVSILVIIFNKIQ